MPSSSRAIADLAFALRHVIATCLASIAAATSAPSQRQFDELLGRGLPVVLDRTEAVVLADVDGDSDLDVLVGNGYPGRQTRLHLNDGAGRFTDVTATHMPADDDETVSLACGDVDGDGDRDLVVGNYDQDRLYRNDGTGRFTDVTAAQLPVDTDRTYAVLLGDVDGDLDLDLIAANENQSRLYRNDGLGRFTNTTGRLPAAAYATSCAALGDIDGDRDLDLVLGNNALGSTGQDRLYRNNGLGFFSDVTATQLPVVHDRTYAVVLGDVDRDGDLDLLFGNSGQDRLALNDGTGRFIEATATHMPVDFEYDLDLALGDVDGDGDSDLVVGHVPNFGPAFNRLYANDGTGRFTDVTAGRMPHSVESARSVALGDLDADGDLDLVLGNGSSYYPEQNRLLWNDGRGSFTDANASRLPPLALDTRAIAVGDLDGDGDLDLIFGNCSTPNFLYRNDGRGEFTDVTATHLTNQREWTSSLALGDVDGDGDLDLVVGTSWWFNGGFWVGAQKFVHINDGTGRFADETATRMPYTANGTSSVALGDIDRDGDLDLALGNDWLSSPGGGQNDLFRNDGTGHFTYISHTHLPADTDDTNAIAFGDVDADGDPDLVTGNSDRCRFYRNDGSGSFADATITHLPAIAGDTRSVSFGDVDGDGDLDLVLGVQGQNRLLRNNGSGVFADVTSGNLPTLSDTTTATAFGDVDADLDLDLLVANGSQAERLHLNDGSGRFLDVSAARLPAFDGAYTHAVALGDLDRDGDEDLLLAKSGINRLLLNLLRQIDAPDALRGGQLYQLDLYARYGPPRQLDLALPFVSAIPADISLPPLGRLGLDPAFAYALPSVVIPQPAGIASISLAVPRDPLLEGLTVYVQALLMQLPTQDRLTNVIADTLIF